MLDPHVAFTSNGFWVPAMFKYYIFGFLQTKSLVLSPAFTGIVLHLPMHGDI